MKAAPQVFELHFLHLPLIEESRVAGIVVEDLSVPVLFGCPQIVPPAPVTVITEIHSQEAVEVGQPLFRQHIERQRRPNVVGNTVGLVAEILEVLVGALVGPRAEKVRRIPEIALALMSLHQLEDFALEIRQHFNLRGYVAL